MMKTIGYDFDEIESCEMIGMFEDEYVYDVEVDDDTHTFICNDILVHNSVFVGFGHAINSCKWQRNVMTEKVINSIQKKFVILTREEEKDFQKTYGFLPNNPNYIKFIENKGENIKNLKDFCKDNLIEVIIMDGYFLKHRDLKDVESWIKVVPNFERELDFVHGLDKYKIGPFFTENLEAYADSFGVKNLEDFELERVSESIINISKKKYIQHVVYEDGIHYDRMSYFFPKGVELVRSSTPYFARERIMDIVKYLFEHPDTFNIKELLRMIKELRREFELAPIDDISMQSSCSNYAEKVLDDKESLKFVDGTHFGVKAGAFYNYTLNNNKEFLMKYERIKSGSKIKYYYCKSDINPVFAYLRGSHPIEIAPEVDYNVQFSKAILSPINSIIEPLGLPEISSRLTVILDIFS